MSFVVNFGSRATKVDCAPTSILQQVLESACKKLGLNGLDHRLVLAVGSRGKEELKSLDHSLQLRVLNLKSTSKLNLIACGANESLKLDLSIEVSDRPQETFQLEIGNCKTETLWSALLRLEAAEPVRCFQLTSRHGIPPAERGGVFELHITRPGFLQPLIEISGMQRKFSEKAEMEGTTFAALGLRSDNEKARKVKLKVSFKYIAPPITEEEKERIMGQVQSKLSERMAQLTQMQEKEEEKGKENDHSSSSTAFSLPSISSPSSSSSSSSSSMLESIPADRHCRLFFNPPGTLSVADLPDEFYDLSPEDFQEYAASVRLEAALTASRGVRHLSSKLHRDYSTTHLRFRLPDHVFLEGKFYSNERMEDVWKFLRENLTVDSSQVELFITPPKQILSHAQGTLANLGLAPSALINIAVKSPPPASLPFTPNAAQSDSASSSAAFKWSAESLVNGRLWQQLIRLPRIQSESEKKDSASGESDGTSEPSVPAAAGGDGSAKSEVATDARNQPLNSSSNAMQIEPTDATASSTQ